MACVHRDDAGAWVLGALDDHDAGVFATHLKTCATCRAEVAGLQPAADTLLLAVPMAVPPPELKDRIMRTVIAEAELLAAAGPEADRPPAHAAPARRSRLRWAPSLRVAIAGSLACAAIAAALTAGVVRDDRTVRTVQAQVSLPSAIAARAVVEVQDDGDAHLEVSGMPAPPEGRVYQVWVLRDGEKRPRPTDALFLPAGNGHANVDVPGGAEGVAAVLVTDEPTGGSKAPTRQPSIVAPLA